MMPTPKQWLGAIIAVVYILFLLALIGLGLNKAYADTPCTQTPEGFVCENSPTENLQPATTTEPAPTATEEETHMEPEDEEETLTPAPNDPQNQHPKTFAQTPSPTSIPVIRSIRRTHTKGVLPKRQRSRTKGGNHCAQSHSRQRHRQRQLRPCKANRKAPHPLGENHHLHRNIQSGEAWKG